LPDECPLACSISKQENKYYIPVGKAKCRARKARFNNYGLEHPFLKGAKTLDRPRVKAT
jgi:hypothetical protein